MHTTHTRSVRASLLFVIQSLLFAFGFFTPALALAAPRVDIWWPTSHATVTGTQPFKALLADTPVESYEMFWQVDGGNLNRMDNNYADYPHKEAAVDVTGWSWRGSGPYKITFVAQRDGALIASETSTLYLDNGLPRFTETAPVIVQEPKPIPTAPAPLPATSQEPVTSSSGLYRNPDSPAARQAAAWRTTNPYHASLMDILASNPTASWFGDWNSNVERDAAALARAASDARQTAVLVAYNIPQRDCGGYSYGGSNNPAGYRAWIDALARGLGSTRAIIVLEPDALAQITCLNSQDQATRYDLLRYAVETLSKNQNASVYLDAGHSNWIDPGTMADRLDRAGIRSARGFALNTSNFMPTAAEITYGEQLSQRTGQKHFVIDTARNGNGSNGEWCNPRGRAIGASPTTATPHALVDAFLWVKTPGESDGTCNGGPSAGSWWPDYALELVRNRP